MKPGGRVCISSWAPVDRSPMMQAMFESMRAIKSDMPGPKTDLESLENPDVLKSEMAAAGFRDVTIHGVTKAVPINSAKELLGIITLRKRNRNDRKLDECREGYCFDDGRRFRPFSACAAD